ncbi:hypothetical protein A2V54_00010 [candidate division WWE3 bacterium RBG_19FT_COMBO_53_11]|uniref:Uncharacterized protein n=1 Tax=candidate division WWE3 bacterium RBG_19FT_COMBO_53_11 TaxID=1802613 RepID=A0A1F4UHB2_UNCKA|nr:MAG: hypothetical protein A2V54_00010 [candidate division WWE3 bacterium RBG_19FT_COMBO_53_11]
MPQGVSEQEKTGLEVKVSKLESSPTSERGKFVSVFGATPREEYPPERGRLFAVVDLKVDPTEDASVIGRLVWDTLSEEYYAPEEETPVSALERAVYAVRDKLRNLSPTATIELGAAAFRGEVAYLAKIGKPALYLRRGTETLEFLTGEDGVNVSSQILEEGDTVVLGSPVFAKNFPPADLPRTEFLEKQFSSGEKVPGFAALLLTLVSSREAREEAVARSRSSRKFWGKVSGVGAGLTRQAKQLVKSVRAPKQLKEKFAAAWKKRLYHGEELAKEKHEEPEVGEQRTEIIDQETKPPRKKFQLPKIAGISLPRVIAVLVLILGISVLFTTWQQAKKARAAEFERLLGEATQSLDEAEGLVGLSNEQAVILVTEARADLDRARELSPDATDVDPLLERSIALLNAIEKITPVGEENLKYDLNVQAQGAQGLALAGAGSATVYVLEGTREAVFSINLSKELPSATELGEGNISGAQELMAEGEYLYLRGSNHVYRLKIKGQVVDEPISFARINKANALGTYLGNIYLLVPGEEQIYKFWNLPGGYAGAQNRIKEAVTTAGVVDMAIDGEIWLLQSDGEIIRLSAGEQVPFSISNLSDTLKEPIKIFTQTGMKRLYILDRGESRIVVLDKSGNFLGQFKGDFLSGATDLWVSSNEKSIFVLAGAKIYQISQ